jgi:hypothetical protein
MCLACEIIFYPDASEHHRIAASRAAERAQLVAWSMHPGLLS